MEGETSTLVLPRRWCYLEVALRLQGSTRLMDAAAAEGDARTNQAARHAALTAEEAHVSLGRWWERQLRAGAGASSFLQRVEPSSFDE